MTFLCTWRKKNLWKFSCTTSSILTIYGFQFTMYESLDFIYVHSCSRCDDHDDHDDGSNRMSLLHDYYLMRPLPRTRRSTAACRFHPSHLLCLRTEGVQWHQKLPLERPHSMKAIFCPNIVRSSTCACTDEEWLGLAGSPRATAPQEPNPYTVPQGSGSATTVHAENRSLVRGSASVEE